MPKKKVNSRAVGHAYERQVAKDYREFTGVNAETSRYTSKKMDDNKIDIDLKGKLPINPQCKRYSSPLNLFKTLAEMPSKDHSDFGGRINVVHYKKPHAGELIAMSREDYFTLIKLAYPRD